MFELVSFDYKGSVKQGIMAISEKEQIELDGSPHFKAFEWNAVKNRMIHGADRTINSKGRTIQWYVMAEVGGGSSDVVSDAPFSSCGG